MLSPSLFTTCSSPLHYTLSSLVSVRTKAPYRKQFILTTMGLAESRNRWYAFGEPHGACFTLTSKAFSRSADGLAKMVTVLVTVFEAAGFTVRKRRLRPCRYINGTLHPGLHCSSSNQRHRGINRQRTLFTSPTLCAKAVTA